jgi:hypothetical protein
MEYLPIKGQLMPLLNKFIPMYCKYRMWHIITEHKRLRRLELLASIQDEARVSTMRTVKTQNNYMRFEVLTAMKMSMLFFWPVTPH